ncbi:MULTISPECIES: 3-deoxy-7-phosphoheptulonate synthase [Nisaea]|uniref:3-deoxy-7-phosphoheptulonate synthase n=1 Tax=Nisaea TaxID=390876 RepID=UPI0004155D48|nr:MULTISPECIES: 3-deoxy-7-phosphoheptulonate synthase [Nisaea]
MAVENKFPGKDLTEDDIAGKIPLVAKKSPDHKTVFTCGGIEIGGPLVPVMAGPNTVENEEMIVESAKAIKASGGHFLRGGAFKPLSFPYRSPKFFETREDGLKWLTVAKQETGLPIVTEVMEIDKIEIVAKHADMLQIGTRNMQNYPLLTEVGKTGMPVMLKRGYGSSLRDWLMAAEYIALEHDRLGITPQIVLCERGVVVPHTHRATSRFLLDLQVVPAAQEVTHLPVMTDPSHATFWQPWVKSMMLASVAAGADSLMLEVHPDPRNAAVDPLQASSFAEFDDMMKAMRPIATAIGRTLDVGSNS